MNIIHEAERVRRKVSTLLRVPWDHLANDHSHDWKRDFHIWLPLMVVSWWLAWRYQDPFISDWDGFDYTAYTITGQPSTLGLGRVLFLGYNHLLWIFSHHWLGIRPEEGYLPLRYGVIAQSGPAILGIYALCKELTTSRLAALFGALLVAGSPFYITYSGRVMSEIPAFLLLGWSLWWMLRSLRLGHIHRFLIASCLVGLSANLREFALFYLPLIPLAVRSYGHSWKIGLKALGLAIFCALAGLIFWTIYDPYIFWPATIRWYKLSAQERTVHPVTIKIFSDFAEYAYYCSAAVVTVAPLALIWLWSNKRRGLLFAFGCCGLLADLLLLANHDLPVNPRYLLTGLIGLAAVCGWCLAELIRVQGYRAVPLLIAVILLTNVTYINMAKERYDQQWSARAAKSYISKIDSLPSNSAFIVGSRTPLVNFYHSIGARPLWKTIPPGSAWPDDKLNVAIDNLLNDGRTVYVDFDPELWQQGAREVNREGRGLEMIKREYKLEQVSQWLYRIVERRRTESTLRESEKTDS